MAWTIGTVLDDFDAVLSGGVGLAYEATIAANMGFVSAAALLAFVLLSWRLLNPRGTISAHDYLQYVLLVIVVFAVFLSWPLVSTYIYPLFSVWPGELSATVAEAISGYSMASPNEAFHSLFIKAISIADQIWGLGSGFGAIPYYLLGLVVLIVFGLMIVIGLGYLLMAKMLIAIAFALGPVFVAFLFFQSLRSVFQGWLSVLITNAILIALVYMTVALFISVSDTYITAISADLEPEEQFNIGAAYTLFGGIAFFVSKHLIVVAQSIGGAFGLPRFAQGVAASAFGSGYRSLANRAKSWGGKKDVADVRPAR